MDGHAYLDPGVSTLEEGGSETEELIEYLSLYILIRLSPDWVVTRWSPTAAEQLEVSQESAMGRRLSECGVKWDWSKLKEALMAALREGQTQRLEDLVLTTQEGRERYLSLTVLPITRKGKIADYVLLGYDVTDRKILQDQLAQSQKLEAIGQLAAGIAHEINTPIQYVGDNARFLQDAFNDLKELLDKYSVLVDGLKTGDDPSDRIDAVASTAEAIDLGYLYEEIPAAISQALQGVETVAEIVRAMKEFSHPGAEDKTPTDINKAIQSTITVARNEWKYAADMKTDFDSALPKVPCFPGELNQVFLNMIVNAAHAITDQVEQGKMDKGLITITTRLDGDWVEIRIMDNGTGVPKEIQSKIFDPFFTTKEVGKGTGQGLAISYLVIVEKHRGRLKLESRPGEGATFVIRLPLIEGDEREDERA